MFFSYLHCFLDFINVTHIQLTALVISLTNLNTTYNRRNLAMTVNNEFSRVYPAYGLSGTERKNSLPTLSKKFLFVSPTALQATNKPRKVNKIKHFFTYVVRKIVQFFKGIKSKLSQKLKKPSKKPSAYVIPAAPPPPPSKASPVSSQQKKNPRVSPMPSAPKEEKSEGASAAKRPVSTSSPMMNELNKAVLNKGKNSSNISIEEQIQRNKAKKEASDHSEESNGSGSVQDQIKRFSAKPKEAGTFEKKTVKKDETPVKSEVLSVESILTQEASAYIAPDDALQPKPVLESSAVPNEISRQKIQDALSSGESSPRDLSSSGEGFVVIEVSQTNEKENDKTESKPINSSFYFGEEFIKVEPSQDSEAGQLPKRLDLFNSEGKVEPLETPFLGGTTGLVDTAEEDVEKGDPQEEDRRMAELANQTVETEVSSQPKKHESPQKVVTEEQAQRVSRIASKPIERSTRNPNPGRLIDKMGGFMEGLNVRLPLPGSTPPKKNPAPALSQEPVTSSVQVGTPTPSNVNSRQDSSAPTGSDPSILATPEKRRPLPRQPRRSLNEGIPDTDSGPEQEQAKFISHQIAGLMSPPRADDALLTSAANPNSPLKLDSEGSILGGLGSSKSNLDHLTKLRPQQQHKRSPTARKTRKKEICLEKPNAS